jgi:stearoyl-CoA desaturase (delta-9 desaturase)
MQIKWLNVILFAYLHGAALYGMVLPWKWSSFALCFIYTASAGFGTTVAAHRYFTHRSFKANKKLRWILILLQTACAQEPILNWARDHRVHHKFTDTNADPYNSQRGFFFSHIGWLMVKKHPEVIRQGKKIDMSDLECDPMLQFQRRWYHLMAFFLNLGIPILILSSMGESLTVIWHGNIFRWVIQLNLVWCVNSVAHLYGTKPYDKAISPTDSRLVGFLAMGEGKRVVKICQISFPSSF